MAIKTYYWNTRKVSSYEYFKHRLLNPKKMVLRYGNAGDIFNVDLIKFIYNIESKNTLKQGNRLLLVGSIMSILKKGDIVNGIGWKGNDLEDISSIISSAKVYGVRGPLTKSLFEKYKANLTNLKFELDPGLLIKDVYGIDDNNAEEKNIIFIPHYRDLWVYKGKYPKNIKVVSIDSEPRKLAQEILKAKIVYSSSLHGIIFSHALNKECIFVKPQSKEPIFKYEDYFLSIGQECPEPIKNIFAINFITNRSTILEKHIGLEDFYFPSKKELMLDKIIT